MTKTVTSDPLQTYHTHGRTDALDIPIRSPEEVSGCRAALGSGLAADTFRVSPDSGLYRNLWHQLFTVVLKVQSHKIVVGVTLQDSLGPLLTALSV